MQHLFRRAAVAVVLFDLRAAEALLKLPDAELGRLFKISLARVMGVATVLNLDRRSVRGQGAQLSSKIKRRAVRRMSPRKALVAEGKLLRAEILCDAWGITEQRLNKRVSAGRVFSVEVEAEQYYPAFFLANELDRKDLAKVVRRLDGLTGWSKWRFFTEPMEPLGGLTPLQAILRGDVKRVLRTAKAAAKQSQKLEKGNTLGTKRS
ncbi:hypothetical protein AWB78_05627 [Caballeronia calidae]|uniref:Antitoxin Xre/MbcA/ParS-like toxin-binding domain-containing protein n=1 Tax=Caballeronia calidae TaxID=1777139 RepID=A0A158DVG8_9BURK|nr:hypothetical protein [Caballeronia calidae]SAK98186.1 hypothetical protein AWB78_05627 [Caballeronia calidae]